jgi:hypothetical protein
MLDKHAIVHIFFLEMDLFIASHISSLAFDARKSSFQKFYGRNHDFFKHYEKSMSQMTNDMFHLS